MKKKKLTLSIVSALSMAGASSASANISSTLESISALSDKSSYQINDVILTSELQRLVFSKNAVQQSKYALMGESSDSDSDNTQETPAMKASLSGFLPPGGGGFVPDGSIASKVDGYGMPLGYCAWDNGTINASANRIGGDASVSNSSVSFAIISSGKDRVFNLSCADVRAGVVSGDDISALVTVGEANKGIATNEYFGKPVNTRSTLLGLDTSNTKPGEMRMVLDTGMAYGWLDLNNDGAYQWEAVSNYFYSGDSNGASAGGEYTTNPYNVGVGSRFSDRSVVPDEALDVDGNLLIDAYETGAAGIDTQQGIYFRRGYNKTNNSAYNLSITTYDHSNNGSSDGLSINGYDGISFSTGSNTRNERLRITQDGKIGIGTSNPTYGVQIDADPSSGAAGIFYSPDADNPNMQHYVSFDGKKDITDQTGLMAYGVRALDDSFQVWKRESATDTFWVNNLSLTKGGKLGLGAQNPTDYLMVSKQTGNVGDFLLNLDESRPGYTGAAHHKALAISGNNVKIVEIGALSSMSAGSSTLDFFFINTDKTEIANGLGHVSPEFVIKQNGDIGIGTISPQAKLDVEGDINSGKIRIDRGDTSGPQDAYLNIDRLGNLGDEIGILIQMDGDGDYNDNNLFDLGTDDIAIEVQSAPNGDPLNATTKFRLWTDGKLSTAGDVIVREFGGIGEARLDPSAGNALQMGSLGSYDPQIKFYGASHPSRAGQMLLSMGENAGSSMSFGREGGGSDFTSFLTINDSGTTVLNGSLHFPLTKNFGGDYPTDNENNSNAIMIGGGAPYSDRFEIFKQRSGTVPTFCGSTNNFDCYIFNLVDANSTNPDGSVIFGRTGMDDVFKASLMVHGPTGRVGVKTKSPEADLHVNGDAMFTGVTSLSKGASDRPSVHYPGSFYHNGTSTSGYTLKTNIDGPDTQNGMHTVRIQGYAYGPHQIIDFTVAFYSYTTNGNFQRTAIINNGSWDPGVVELATDTDDKVMIRWSNNAYFPRFYATYFATGISETRGEALGWTMNTTTGSLSAYDDYVDVSAVARTQKTLHTAFTGSDDWLNSPISIRERGRVGSSTLADTHAPNLNFHWSGQMSRSLWMDASGRLNYGSYDVDGNPNIDGVFRTGTISVQDEAYFNGTTRFNGDVNLTDQELVWSKNTDTAKIGFVNTGDLDTDESYFYFQTSDNNTEYFRWQHQQTAGDGGQLVEYMRLTNEKLAIADGMRMQASSYNLSGYNNWSASSGFGSTGGGAAIVNESGTYNALMILGNDSAGGDRHIEMWDSVQVHGPVSGTSFTSTSDARMKKNITDIQSGLATIRSLNGKTYYWKESFSKDQTRQYGFVAQDLLNTLPEAVVQDTEGYYSVKYDAVTPIIVEAVKELDEKVDEVVEKTNKHEIEIQKYKVKMKEYEHRIKVLETGAQKEAAPTKAPLNETTIKSEEITIIEDSKAAIPVTAEPKRLDPMSQFYN